MRKLTLPLALGVLLVYHACATLDPSEIRNLDRVTFDAPQLVPQAEPTELRIDIVRQQIPNMILENTYTYQDVPYHPLGFDIGNGLFYDLNGNLSLRVEYLLGLENEPVFTIKKEDAFREERGVEYYTLRQDSLLKSYGHKKRITPLLVRGGSPDSVSFEGMRRSDFAIVQRDSSVVYRGKRREKDILRQQPDGNYTLDNWLTSREFQKQGNTVELGKNFIIELTNQDRTILIARKAFFSKDTLFTIERGADKILIYDHRGAGKMIKLGKEEFALYQNRTLLDRYAVQEKP
ncbi:MAG: hypothetical protein KKG00_11795 [Bacteroidetes bacterium]|nr:hypothetical protein [Bacteroidota bacterium]